MTTIPQPWAVGEAPPWPGSLQTFGDRELFVRRTPEVAGGARAVMVHGLGGQSTNWTDLMGLLAPDREIWAPDLPGFGSSPPAADGDYSLSAFTAVVERVVETMSAPVDLFGNSLGGAVCVRLAARRPELVRSLVLTSPALPDLRPRRHTVGVPAVAIPGLGEQLWRKVAALPPQRQVQAMIELNFGDPTVVSPTRRAEAIRDYERRRELPYAGEVLSGSARGLMKAFLETGATGLWRQASSLRCPTLVFYGGRDRLVNPRRARRAARAVPHARIVMLPRAGHVAQLEAPTLVARLTQRFWRECVPDAA